MLVREETMLPQTRFLSRMLGVYCLLMGLFMVTRAELAWRMITLFCQDQPLVFIVAIMVLFGGLAMVLAHNVWSGGAATIIVTIMGWATLAKGVVLLFAPPEAIMNFYLHMIHTAKFMYVDGALALVLGIYLSYAGFKNGVATRER